MRLEPEVWDALREVCLREGIELRDLIKSVERNASAGGRTSAVRVHVLAYFRAAATAAGHAAVGHGNATATGMPMSVLSEIELGGEPGGSLPAGLLSEIEVDTNTQRDA